MRDLYPNDPKNTADFLKEAVRTRQNILVIGGTVSGKTTLANAILDEMSKYECGHHRGYPGAPV